jgi:transcriptional regulator with XRE-family HTH domain
MFGLRLAAERKRLKLNQLQVADLLGVSRSVIAMTETEQTALGAERLLELGSHGFDVLKILTDEPGQTAAGRLLNWQLCLTISDRVDAWTKSKGIKLSNEKKAIVVKHLYLQFAARGQVDEAALDETLQMAA